MGYSVDFHKLHPVIEAAVHQQKSGLLLLGNKFRAYALHWPAILQVLQGGVQLQRALVVGGQMGMGHCGRVQVHLQFAPFVVDQLGKPGRLVGQLRRVLHELKGNEAKVGRMTRPVAIKISAQFSPLLLTQYCLGYGKATVDKSADIVEQQVLVDPAAALRYALGQRAFRRRAQIAAVMPLKIQQLLRWGGLR
jgi:hypothetical protein